MISLYYSLQYSKFPASCTAGYFVNCYKIFFTAYIKLKKFTYALEKGGCFSGLLWPKVSILQPFLVQLFHIKFENNLSSILGTDTVRKTT